MAAYLSISVGETVLDAVPIVASNEERLVRAALRAIHSESELMVSEGAIHSRPIPPDGHPGPLGTPRRAA